MRRFPRPRLRAGHAERSETRRLTEHSHSGREREGRIERLNNLAAEDWRKRVGIESAEGVHSVSLGTQPWTLSRSSVHSGDALQQENTETRTTRRGVAGLAGSVRQPARNQTRRPS